MQKFEKRCLNSFKIKSQWNFKTDLPVYENLLFCIFVFDPDIIFYEFGNDLKILSFFTQIFKQNIKKRKK